MLPLLYLANLDPDDSGTFLRLGISTKHGNDVRVAAFRS
jgi:hypothetical protein